MDFAQEEQLVVQTDAKPTIKDTNTVIATLPEQEETSISSAVAPEGYTPISVWDLEEEYPIDPDTFLSMGRATPLAGWKVFGRCVATVCDDKVVYRA